MISAPEATDDAPVWIGGRELEELVPAALAMDLVGEAMKALSAGRVDAPQRWSMPLAEGKRMGLMPGAMRDAECFGIKVLSLFDAAARGDRASHQGVMLLFNHRNGRPLCTIDAASLTALRTAAASAVATRAMARPGSTRLAVIGCGALAPLHIAMIRESFAIDTVTLWNRDPAKARALSQTLAAGPKVIVEASPEAAIQGADIVCMLTAAREPILSGADIAPGQHFNLVGSSTAIPREVDDAFVARSRYVVDCRAHALDQAAELLSAMRSGLVDERHIIGEIGEVLSGQIAGRTKADEITVYKSLGHIAQDLAVANAAFRRIATRPHR